MEEAGGDKAIVRHKQGVLREGVSGDRNVGSQALGYGERNGSQENGG